MEQFEFRLKALMKLRKHREDTARLQLAQARRSMQQIRQRTEDLKLRQQAVAQSASDLGQQPTIQAVQAGYARYHLLQQRRNRAHQQLKTAAEQHEKQRRTAQNAHRELQTVQRLRDRKRQEHRKRVKKHRRRLLDDTANIRAAREAIDQSRKLPGAGGEK